MEDLDDELKADLKSASQKIDNFFDSMTESELSAFCDEIGVGKYGTDNSLYYALKESSGEKYFYRSK